MLHILWMLVKLILIIIGIVLGLVLLTVLLVLFCPVRYNVRASKDREADLRQADASVSVSWLFYGIWIRIFLKDGSMSQDIRFLGIPVGKLLDRKKPKRNAGKKTVPKNSVPKNSGPKPETPEIPASTVDETGQPDAERIPPEPPKEATVEKQMNEMASIWNKMTGILEKLKQIPGKIAGRIRKLSFTLRNICDKIDWWKQFAEERRTKEALSLVKNQFTGLLKHVFPTRIRGKVTFGSEDPSVTGSVLAVLGMTMPLHKNCIEVLPVFDGTNVLEGDVQLRGRIYGIMFLRAAIIIYFNKNVKYVISRWKHKEG